MTEIVRAGPEDLQVLREKARSLGMHRFGVAHARPLEEDHLRYTAFLAENYHGSMQYLAENVAARRTVSSEDLLPETQSVLVCALAYHRPDDESAGPTPGIVARYARGGDYHNFFRKKLRRLAAWIRERFPQAQARPVVDTAPVLERAWARMAGVGFVGKHGCIIVPGLGSYVLLGEVLTTVQFPEDSPQETRCGTCTLCLDACPTKAFVRPFVLDASRCIAYLTIELQDSIPEALREAVGTRLFGCDICQEICPYNRTSVPSLESTKAFAPRERWKELRLEDFLRWNTEQFAAFAEGTPLPRAGRDGMARNAAIVLGNASDSAARPVLEEASRSHESPMVRESAQWALLRLDAREKK